MRLLYVLIAVFCLVSLFACSGKKKDKEPYAGEGAEQLYYLAKEDIQEGYYTQAIGRYESLEARYPFGKYTQQAQLELAYAYYKAGEPDSAVAAADRFIKLNPSHPNVDYAHYLKGLANSNPEESFFDRFFYKDPSDRDSSRLRQAFNDFSTLINTYPDSRYVDDSRQRMIYLRNLLAKYEMKVADYYMRRGAYVAALNRCNYVLEHYQGADNMPEAISTLVLAYKKLGLNDLANDAFRVLEVNYPKVAEELERGIRKKKKKCLILAFCKS